MDNPVDLDMAELFFDQDTVKALCKELREARARIKELENEREAKDS